MNPERQGPPDRSTFAQDPPPIGEGPRAVPLVGMRVAAGDSGGRETDPEDEVCLSIRARIRAALERHVATGYYPAGGVWRTAGEASQFYEQAKRRDRQLVCDALIGLAGLAALVLFLAP